MKDKKKAKPTPGPWQSLPERLAGGHVAGQGPSVVDAGGGLVARVVRRGHGPALDPEGEANAAFIIRACNSHAELLDLLEEAHDALSHGELSTRIALALARARGQL